MYSNKKKVETLIKLRELKDDKPKDFAIMVKSHRNESFSKFIPFSYDSIQKFYSLPLIGLKIRFNNTTVFINGKHSN